jgi:hypothetical protein
MAGCNDDASGCLCSGHGHLYRGSGTKSKIDNIDSQSHQRLHYQLLYHGATDSTVATYDHLDTLFIVLYKGTKCCRKLYDIDGSKIFSGPMANGASDSGDTLD